MEPRLSRCWLLTLLVIAYYSSILALDFGERRGPSYGSLEDSRQPSSHQSQRQSIRVPRRLSGRHNDPASTDSGHKLSSNSLIGGHLRAETTTPAAPSNTSTSPTNRTDSTSSRSVYKESSLDDGLLLSSAGNGKERKGSTKPSESTSSSDDEEKKTLSQQVKEGKYGLIQNEIYPEEPRRPGIISYLSNPEVPRDNAKNLGGLDEEEIWLAENHVLVLKGGSFPEVESDAGDNSWPPIDDYKAPRRQVKIPPRPKVPPPFPVQLVEGGPVQLIGTNGSSLVENATLDFEALPGGFKGFLPGEGPYFPFPSSNVSESSNLSEKKTKAEGGAPGPFYPALPPGAVVVPPPSNQTDYDDEDQSIYYPPPYSFVYSADNSTAIPPGPLVPGIILPPPPDFFASLEQKKPTTKEKHGKRPSTTPALVTRPAYLPPRKSSTKLYKSVSVTSAPLGAKTVIYNPKPFSRSKFKNTTFRHYQPEKTTARIFHTLPLVEATSPVPVTSSTSEKPNKYHFQQILGNQVIESSTEKSPWRSVANNKPVPIITYYAATTPTSVEQPVETTPSSVKNILTTERYPSQASYYFYEETSNEATPSSTAEPHVFYSTTAESPPYYKLDLPHEHNRHQQPQPQQQQQPLSNQQQKQEEEKVYYDVEMVPSQQTSKDYNVKLIDSIVKDPQIFRYLDADPTSSHEKFETQPIRSQSPRVLHSEPLYYQPVPTRSSPKLSYFTTPKPKNYYRRPEIGEGFEIDKPNGKSKPIYQYSFEATNYAKRGNPTIAQKPRIEEPVLLPQIQQPRRQKELPLYHEYQDIQSVGEQYDYGGGETLADQQARAEQLPYLGSKKKERPFYQQSTTISPIRETTIAAHQQYFTKQDEQLLDDVTKEYFTMFGKKLSGKLPSTTPIYGKSSVTERPKFVASYGQDELVARQPPNAFRASNIKVHYGDQTPGPYALQDQVILNFKQPLPSLTTGTEFVSAVNGERRPSAGHKFRTRPVVHVANHLREFPLQSAVRPHYEHSRGYAHQGLDQQQQQQQQQQQREPDYAAGADPRPVSLDGDIAVNFKDPRPALNPDAEFIGGGPPSRLDANADKANSYFAYRLPGDAGHFYFLTPQAISREDSTASYLYQRPRGSRLLRRRRGRDSV